MRIIAGEFRSRMLKAPDTDKTRPTTDRARETLFNVLTNLITIEGIHVLDLFAGSGALGLEAVSRGAAHATFIEQDRKAAAALKTNVATLNVQNRCSIVQDDVYRHLATLPAAKFDLVLADPPYDDERARLELPSLIAASMAHDAIFVLEHRSSDVVPRTDALDVVRELKAGEAGFTILRLTP